MKIKSMLVAFLSVSILFGGIFIADTFGVWQTESTKQPSKFTEGAFKGLPIPDDIRGSYSFKDIEDAFDIDAVILAKAFNINSDDPSSIKAKDIEEIYGELGENIEIGTGSVKKFVSLYTGLPYEYDEYLPMTVVDVLMENDQWNQEMSASIKDYLIDVEFKSELLVSDGEESSEEEHIEEIGIKGKTTVADAISYGISLEEIEAILGVEINNENMLIRDICEQNGLSFSTIKQQLNDKIE